LTFTRFRGYAFLDDNLLSIGAFLATPLNPPLGRGQTPGAELVPHLPKLWIGYLLCLATFIDEGIVLSQHPEIASGQTFIPPLHLFLLTFVSGVYWLVCIHRLHVVLSRVPGWKHPISPARAVWFHFIPVYFIYWLYRWPKEAGNFVNWRVQKAVLRPRNAGIMILIAYFSLFLLGPGGLALLFFALSYVVAWIGRALLTPLAPPRQEGDAPE
jgi:hypothetical protein